MGEIRMSLADAATLLGIAPNSVRSRFKVGKIRGERDNQGKLWVWLDHTGQGSKQDSSNLSIEGSKRDRSKPSNEGSNKAHIEALEAHLRTLTDQLNLAQTEMSALRIRASAADGLKAQVAGLEALRDEVRADRDHWREVAERLLLTDQRSSPDQATETPSTGPLHVNTGDYAEEAPRSFWSRLFGRS